MVLGAYLHHQDGCLCRHRAAGRRVPAQVARRGLLVALDLVRLGVAVCLPFVDALWQVFVLVFILQSASAAFTPVFQATIPDVLPDEGQYTRALSLSRLAYDLENIASPMLAALLLTLVSYHSLFLGTAMGFLASAAFVVSVLLPSPKPSRRRGVYERTTRGIRICLATPRLRGLLALNLAAAAAGAMVLVNTIVLVRTGLSLGETDACRGSGCVRRGFDDNGLRIADLAGPCARPTSHAVRRSAPHCDTGRDGGIDSAHTAELRPSSGRVVRDRCWLFYRADAVRSAFGTFGPRGRSPRRLCRAVCALARLLARDLSALRLVADNLRHSRHTDRACQPGTCGAWPCAPPVVVEGGRLRRTRP